MTNTTPLEDTEQIQFVQWLDTNNIKHTAVPNSTYTKSWNQKRKNYAMGLRKGFPDIVLLIPPNRSVDGEGYFLCIEMKRQKGGVLSPEQKEWRDAINGLNVGNVQSYVCNGLDEAKKVVEHYCNDINTSIF